MPRKVVASKKRRIDESTIALTREEIITPLLRESSLFKTFEIVASRQIHQERFVKIDDVANYGIDDILEFHSLDHLFSHKNTLLCYPRLVYLFYTNMIAEKEKHRFRTKVFQTKMNVTVKTIGESLGIPYTGIDVNDIALSNENILEKMFLPNKYYYSKMPTSVLRYTARILAIITSYNLTQMSGSHSTVTNVQIKCIYALIGGVKVNWAKFIMDTIIHSATNNRPTVPLAHGHFLTALFNAFDISFENEADILEAPMVFDARALARMNLNVDLNQNVLEENLGEGSRRRRHVIEEESEKESEEEEEEGGGEEEVEGGEEAEEEEEVPAYFKKLQKMLVKKLNALQISQDKGFKEIHEEIKNLKTTIKNTDDINDGVMQEVFNRIQALEKETFGRPST